MAKNDWLWIPRPVPCAWMLAMLPVYFLLWWIINGIIKPSYPAFARNYLLTKPGEFFGPDTPGKILWQSFIAIAVIAGIVSIIYYCTK